MHRELTSGEIEALLAGHTFGHLGCVQDQTPYVFPMAYAYHESVLYGQTTIGKKVDILRANPRVCFQVEQTEGNVWKSVMCWGTFQELDFAQLSTTEAAELAELLSRKLGSIQGQFGIAVPFSFNGQPQPVTVQGKTSTLFRIVVDEKTGLSNG